MNNLQRNNSRVDEAKDKVSDLEHKEAKNNHSEQQEEKRIQNNADSVSSLWDDQGFLHLHHRGARRRRERARNWKPICKNNERKLP